MDSFMSCAHTAVTERMGFLYRAFMHYTLNVIRCQDHRFSKTLMEKCEETAWVLKKQVYVDTK